MGQSPKQSNLVSFRELLLAEAIQIDALTQLPIESGVISEERFFAKLKQVQVDGPRRQEDA